MIIYLYVNALVFGVYIANTYILRVGCIYNNPWFVQFACKNSGLDTFVFTCLCVGCSAPYVYALVFWCVPKF